MRFYKAFGAVAGVLTFAATLLGTAAPTNAGEWIRCYDAGTTMYIGKIVDGQCLSPYLPIEILGSRSPDHAESDDGFTSVEGGQPETTRAQLSDAT